MDKLNEFFSQAIIDSRITGLDRKSIEEKKEIPPYRVEIQPTTRCNRNCSFCSHAIRNQRGTEIDYKTVCSVIDELFALGCRKVSFSGGGEPFAWRKGDLVSAISYAHAKNMEVTLTTNGDSFWNSAKGAITNTELLEWCSSIIINTPAVTDELFDELAGTKAGWSRIRKVLLNLTALKKQAGSNCNICCVVVVSRQNMKSLNEIDSRVSALGVSQIYYKLVKDFESNNLAAIAVEEAEISRLKRTVSKDGSIWLSQFLDSLVVRTLPEACRCWSNDMGMNAIVDPGADVYICTPYVGKRPFSIGNIHSDGGFAKVWKGDKRFVVIETLNKRYTERKCPKECRLMAHNILVDDYLYNKDSGAAIITNAGIDSRIS